MYQLDSKEVYEPKSDKWNEVNSEWVELPDGKLYLLVQFCKDADTGIASTGTPALRADTTDEVIS